MGERKLSIVITGEPESIAALLTALQTGRDVDAIGKEITSRIKYAQENPEKLPTLERIKKGY